MRTRSKRARRYPICWLPMRKNGHDRNGRQRWQCDACKATTTASAEARGARQWCARESTSAGRACSPNARTPHHPDDPKAATSRSGWWCTHLPLRRAYFRLERLFNDGTLFCLFDPTLSAHSPVPRDSDRLEEGSTPRSNACSSTTAACPRHTCAAPANGTAICIAPNPIPPTSSNNTTRTLRPAPTTTTTTNP